MGFGFNLPGQIMAEVFMAVSTAAVGVAAGAADGDEASGQDGALGVEFLLAGLKEAANERGVFGNLHRYRFHGLDGAFSGLDN